jgi:siderophore synthetase component
VQITNCFRVKPRHEVEAATTLSRLLKPLRTELKQRFPGTVLLSEPAGRAPRLGSDLTDQLGVISREGWQDKLPPGVVPVLAAALTEPVPTPYVARILAEASTGRDRILRWWNGYLNCVVPPVLYAFFNHGIVFEAHLQNILLGIDRNGNPQAVVLRDLEGVKLVDSQPDRAVELAAMPTKVREHVATTTARGWNRVAYCLLVNNVAGVLSALADRDPDAEPALWSQVRATLQFFRRRHGDFPLLRAVLEGHPVPAKMNLMTRWRASADRDSNYVPVNLPLGLK